MSAKETEQYREATGFRNSRRRHRTWVAVLLGAFILFCGIAIGTGLTILWAQRKVVDAIRHPEKTPERIAARMGSKMDLNEAQIAHVTRVIRAKQKDLNVIRREIGPRVNQILEQIRVEIAHALTPAQVESWNTHFNTLRRKWLPPPDRNR